MEGLRVDGREVMVGADVGGEGTSRDMEGWEMGAIGDEASVRAAIRVGRHDGALEGRRRGRGGGERRGCRRGEGRAKRNVCGRSGERCGRQVEGVGQQVVERCGSGEVVKGDWWWEVRVVG